MATSRFSDSYDLLSDEAQSEKTTEYEGQVANKLERGVKNFFLSNLEVPHGVQSEIKKRQEKHLPVKTHNVIVGLFHGAVMRFARTGVGLYEIVTCPYPQKPILPEIDEWLH